MSGGLFALLDDVALLAKLAAASVDDIGAAAGRASMTATNTSAISNSPIAPHNQRGSAASACALRVRCTRSVAVAAASDAVSPPRGSGGRELL